MRSRRGFIAGGAAILTALLAACSKKPAEKPTEPQATASVAAPPAPPPPPPLPDTVKVSLVTEKGEVVIELQQKKAPLTVANFLKYVDAGKLDGANFWRAANSGPSGFVQATANGPTFPPIAHESTKDTGLSHTNGTVSMSRFAPGTATADFVVCVGDNTYMDAGREGSDDKLGYAAFGKVIKGMDVVRRILGGKIAKHTREGGWAGQMLAKPVIIISAKRVEETAESASSSS